MIIAKTFSKLLNYSGDPKLENNVWTLDISEIMWSSSFKILRNFSCGILVFYKIGTSTKTLYYVENTVINIREQHWL